MSTDVCVSGLVAQARDAAQRAWSPYSGLKSGAALLGASGRVYCGANVEIAGSTASCCAARVAVITALVSGERAFAAIAATGDLPGSSAVLCGVCRQTLAEFCQPETPVYLAGADSFRKVSVDMLLPEWNFIPPRWPELEPPGSEPTAPVVFSGGPPDLIHLAFEGQRRCYAPYSNYYVGAALLAKSGRVYIGGNIESAGRTPAVCAERSALFQAVYAGEREFQSIAVVGGLRGTAPEGFVHANPCAVCRQALAEFDGGEMKFYLARTAEDYLTRTLEDILPHAFRINSYA